MTVSQESVVSGIVAIAVWVFVVFRLVLKEFAHIKQQAKAEALESFDKGVRCGIDAAARRCEYVGRLGVYRTLAPEMEPLAEHFATEIRRIEPKGKR